MTTDETGNTGSEKEPRRRKRLGKAELRKLQKLVDASYQRSKTTTVILLAILVVGLLVYAVT